MENNSWGGDPRPTASDLTAEEARAALSGLETDGAKLADQVVTPWWYHPALGLVVAMIIGTQALPVPASTITLPFAILALPVLVLVYRRRYGLWVAGPVGPRSRRLQWSLAVVFLLGIAVMLAVRFTTLPYGWVVVPMVIVVPATTVLGRRYDDALREELRQGGAERR